jgi:GNAT superfamily N-acetyltransferase
MNTEQVAFTVRRARISDRNRLRAMQTLSLRTMTGEFYTPAEIESFLTYVGTIDDNLLAEGTYHLIEAGDEIVASGGWSQFRANFSSGADPAADLSVAKARSVFVHPDWIRHGLGSRLMRVAEAEAFGAGFNEMELNAMLSGVGFYEKLGYRRIRDISLSMPENVVFRGVTMRKPLTQAAARAPASSGVVEHRLTGRRCGAAA